MNGRGAPQGHRVPASLRRVLFVVAFALAAAQGLPAAADSVDGEAQQIARLLRCPVCQSVSVAESPAELAQQMRHVIREQLEQGRTRPEIIAYFVERYGEGVLLDPPKQGFAALAWLTPLLALLVGGSLVWRTLRRRAGPVRARSVELAVPNNVSVVMPLRKTG